MERPQIVERGIAGAEIVDGETHAELPQAGKRGAVLLRRLHQDRLCQLELEMLGRDVEARQRARYDAVEVGGELELGAGQVDREDRDANLAIEPAPQLGAGTLDDPMADRNDASRGLRDRNESVRKQESAGRMVPPDQRLETDNPAGRELDLRLVIELELVALQRMPQIAFRGDAFPNLPVELGDVKAVLVAPLVLGAIEREVGLRHHVVGVLDLLGIGDDADARRRVHLIAVEHEWSGKLPAKLGGQDFGALGASDLALQHGELVAAEARHEVRLAHAILDPARCRLQQGIPYGMSERVVDVLEVVEIEIEDGEIVMAALDAGEFESEALQKARTVCQPGQGIGARQSLDLLHRPLLVRDVAEEPDAPEIFAPGIVETAGVPLNNASVGELQLLMALDLRVRIEVTDPRQEFVLVPHAGGDGREHGLVASRVHEVGRNVPKLHEMPVIGDDLVVLVDDEDGVRRALDRRGQQDMGEGELVFGALALGDIVDEAFDADQAVRAVAQSACLAVEPGSTAVGFSEPEVEAKLLERPIHDAPQLGDRLGPILCVQKGLPAGRRCEDIARIIAVARDVLRQIGQGKRLLRSNAK